MKKLSKLFINPEKLMKNEELINLREKRMKRAMNVVAYAQANVFRRVPCVDVLEESNEV